MSILAVPVKGVFWTNCYFYADEEAGRCFILDPGAEGEKLINIAWSHGGLINGILLTHGHFDHMAGIMEIRRKISLLDILRTQSHSMTLKGISPSLVIRYSEAGREATNTHVVILRICMKAYGKY
ncbi:MAG: MBL fold metallo-hydrolase [Synergistaceae bacterium]|nr:MBL fold metallo-hydrolase [Synergistaceae bacterium]